METHLQFSFRNKVRKAFLFIDNREEPCFIFLILEDKELIKEFGEDLSIKTDFENILPSDNISVEIEKLREAIFHELRHTIEFAKAKEEYPKGQKWPSQKQII